MFKPRYRFIIFFTIIVLLLSVSGSPSFEAQQNDDRTSLARKFIKQADIASEKLHSRPRSERREQEYLTIIELYRRAIDVDQEHLCGDEALMAMAELSEEIAYYLRKSRYYYNAVEYYQQITKLYPNSPHQARALIRLAKVLEQPPFDPQTAISAYLEVIKQFPNSLISREARANIIRLTEVLNGSTFLEPEAILERQITAIRSFTGSDYARIVIDLSAPVTYEKTLMSSSSLTIQVHEAKLLPMLLEKNLVIDTEGLLKNIDFEQSNKGVRFNLKFDKIRDYAIFTINNPDRLMIDLRGKNSENLDTKSNKLPNSLPINNSLTELDNLIQKQNETRLSLMRALGLKVKRIVIDAGHGGHDIGAKGPNGLQEKDLVLDVAIRLRDIIKQQLPEIDVVMTRDKDNFVTLEERTAIANAQGADLFLSIHANSGQAMDASGVETYYLSINANKEELEVAARENASTARNARDLQSLLQKIALEDKVLESQGFAKLVQGNLVNGLGKINQAAGVDRGVKKAPFIVLIGANMPSVLSEISFVSNPEQAKLLQTKEFRQNIAQSLFNGIYSYVEVLQKGSNTIASK